MQLQLAYTLRTLLRDSLAGQLVYYVSGRRIGRQTYELPGYEMPERYIVTDGFEQHSASSDSTGPGRIEVDSDCPADPVDLDSNNYSGDSMSDDLEKMDSACTADPNDPSRPETDKELVIVEWDSDDDPEKPVNWPLLKKIIISSLICILTASVYIATAIFTPGIKVIQSDFGCSSTEAMLGITLYVWGLGIGPMFVGAFSESPAFGGRNYIYFISQAIFIALQIPTALARNIGSFAVLRFLSGVFSAPPMANGVATFADMYTFEDSAWAVIAWNAGAVAGPYVGPLIGGALTGGDSWRWSFWYTLAQAGAVFVLMFFLLPETSDQALLMRKGRRLRKLTGNKNITSPGEIMLRKQTWGYIFKEAFSLPVVLILREPVVLLINLHLSLLYALMYLYFQSFPLVFREMFHFTLASLGAAYLSLMVGVFAAIIGYGYYLYRYMVIPTKKKEPIEPERLFVPVSIFGVVCAPLGVMIFAWSSTPTSHWIGPLIGAGIFGGATFLVFQTYLSYLGRLYPTRAASITSGNMLMRCLIGGAFPLFGEDLYRKTAINNFPVGWGCSIVAFCVIALIPLPIYLRMKGARLRDLAIEKYGPKLRTYPRIG